MKSVEELKREWNAQADMMNQWDELGLDEIVHFAQAQMLADVAAPPELTPEFLRPHLPTLANKHPALLVRQLASALLAVQPDSPAVPSELQAVAEAIRTTRNSALEVAARLCDRRSRAGFGNAEARYCAREIGALKVGQQPARPRQDIEGLAHEIWAMAQGPQPISEAVDSIVQLLRAAPQAQPAHRPGFKGDEYWALKDGAEAVEHIGKSGEWDKEGATRIAAAIRGIATGTTPAAQPVEAPLIDFVRDAIDRAIRVFDDVLQGIADWEETALAEAVREAQAPLRAAFALAAVSGPRAPEFSVQVSPMRASNGTTYVVCLDRTDRPADAKPWDDEYRITPINRNDVDEANSEGETWAKFLGVEFTPCQAVEEGVQPNTVPEYGANTKPATVDQPTDTQLLDFLRDESADLRCFAVPTGGGDADIGWKIVTHHMADPNEREVAAVHHDDPREAIALAIRWNRHHASQGSPVRPLEGEQTLTHSEFCIGQEFLSAAGERRWRCTDKGTRTVIAIRIDNAHPIRDLSGPPYGVAEEVFDEDDIKGCTLP